MAKVWNILGYLIILMLLFIISFVNIEEIYNLYLNNIYVFLYFIFLFCSLFFYLFGGIKNKIKSKEFLYIIQFILCFCILLIPGILINHYFLLESLGQNNLYLRVYGKIAFFYFAFALIISPILEFVKNNILRENLILTRKILGILSFIFFLKHGLEYFALEYIFQTQYYINTPYLDYVIKNLLVRYDALSGVISGILMLILGLTSNKFSVKFLGKKWKKMQNLVFPAFLISAIHVAFASRFESFYIFLISLVVITRLIAYLNRKQRRNSGKIIGYICIPCGYIYDEKIGDLDSGILPGTKFEDIPNNWKCPVCGVTKDDFEPIYEGEEIREKAKIIGYKMLTKDVLELKIKVLNLDKIEVNPGQFAKITMFDKIGDFTRSYSVAKQKGNLLTFGIKLKEGGRGGELLKKSKIGDILIFSGISGKFVLKNTKNPKIFIATGTGISPIINMITGGLHSENNYLFFGVEKQKDLFYLDEISKIKNLKIEIFLSREKVDSYNFGRIDLLKYDFTKNIEFYICGNPGLVKSLKKDLNNKGFKDIFTEEF